MKILISPSWTSWTIGRAFGIIQTSETKLFWFLKDFFRGIIGVFQIVTLRVKGTNIASFGTFQLVRTWNAYGMIGLIGILPVFAFLTSTFTAFVFKSTS